MCQHIRIRNIKKDLFYPMVFIHRIKGQSNLIKLSFRKLTTQTIINDLQVCLRQLRCFLTPYICQFSTLKCDRFQFFTLFLIIHATKNNLIPICPAGQFQRWHVNLPVPVNLIPKHPIHSTSQLSKRAVTIRNIRFSNTDQIPAFIFH